MGGGGFKRCRHPSVRLSVCHSHRHFSLIRQREPLRRDATTGRTLVCLVCSCAMTRPNRLFDLYCCFYCVLVRCGRGDRCILGSLTGQTSTIDQSQPVVSSGRSRSFWRDPSYPQLRSQVAASHRQWRHGTHLCRPTPLSRDLRLRQQHGTGYRQH